MTIITRGWPPARRAQQALNCLKTKPWKHSTGPKTRRGKDKVKNNAIKHGVRSSEGIRFRKLLREQREFVRSVISGNYAYIIPNFP